jgi:hypothetical protein
VFVDFDDFLLASRVQDISVDVRIEPTQHAHG